MKRFFGRNSRTIRVFLIRQEGKGLSALALLFVLTAGVLTTAAQPVKPSNWRTATDKELAAIIPARAPVVQERIETELRTASGITDGHGKFIAGVVLITAGYSADGKYSHFFMTQAPIKIGDLALAPGQYLIGWEHKDEDSLNVKFYEALSGKPLGTVEATLSPSIKRVESFRIWPPGDRSLIQIGRFTFSYRLVE